MLTHCERDTLSTTFERAAREASCSKTIRFGEFSKSTNSTSPITTDPRDLPPSNPSSCVVETAIFVTPQTVLSSMDSPSGHGVVISNDHAVHGWSTNEREHPPSNHFRVISDDNPFITSRNLAPSWNSKIPFGALDNLVADSRRIELLEARIGGCFETLSGKETDSDTKKPDNAYNGCVSSESQDNIDKENIPASGDQDRADGDEMIPASRPNSPSQIDNNERSQALAVQELAERGGVNQELGAADVEEKAIQLEESSAMSCSSASSSPRAGHSIEFSRGVEYMDHCSNISTDGALQSEQTQRPGNAHLEKEPVLSGWKEIFGECIDEPQTNGASAKHQPGMMPHKIEEVMLKTCMTPAKRKAVKFSMREDDAIRRGVTEFGEDWEKIVAWGNLDRTPQQIKNRHKRMQLHATGNHAHVEPSPNGANRKRKLEWSEGSEMTITTSEKNKACQLLPVETSHCDVQEQPSINNTPLRFSNLRAHTNQTDMSTPSQFHPSLPRSLLQAGSAVGTIRRDVCRTVPRVNAHRSDLRFTGERFKDDTICEGNGVAISTSSMTPTRHTTTSSCLPQSVQLCSSVPTTPHRHSPPNRKIFEFFHPQPAANAGNSNLSTTSRQQSDGDSTSTNDKSSSLPATCSRTSATSERPGTSAPRQGQRAVTASEADIFERWNAERRTFEIDMRRMDGERMRLMNELQKVESELEIERLRVREAETEWLKEREEEKERMKLMEKKFNEKHEKTMNIVVEALRSNAHQKARAERRKAMEDSMRLATVTMERHGVEFRERWREGFAFSDLQLKLNGVISEREEAEKLKKERTKSHKKSAAAAAAAIANGTVGNDEDDTNEEVDEIYKMRIKTLKEEEAELNSQRVTLIAERDRHIRNVRRIRDEDGSRFAGFPLLGKKPRYLLLELLGKGGFSEVFKGMDLWEMQEVACKLHTLSPQWNEAKRDNYSRHSLREYQIHRNLRHTYIVRLYDVFEIDAASFCTVLEYVDGMDLDQYLQARPEKCLPEKEAKCIIAQVFSALKYLNQQNPPIIHYDLKPANLLYSRGVVRLTDFGLSKIADIRPSHLSAEREGKTRDIELTSQGSGTYWYQAPECFSQGGAGVPRISNKVDVWAAGVIFYQMLYGRRPFCHGLSQQSILAANALVNDARVLDFPAKPSVSQEAKDFIKRLLEYKTRLRPDVFAACQDSYLAPMFVKYKSNTTALTPTTPSKGSKAFV